MKLRRDVKPILLLLTLEVLWLSSPQQKNVMKRRPSLDFVSGVTMSGKGNGSQEPKQQQRRQQQTLIYEISMRPDKNLYNKKNKNNNITNMFHLSQTLRSTQDPHGPNTTWLVHLLHGGVPWNILPSLLNETLKIRMERQGLHHHHHNNNINFTNTAVTEEFMSHNNSQTQNATSSSLVHHHVLEKEGFKLVFLDQKDRLDSHGVDFIQNVIRPLIGWQHTYFITRSTTSSPYRNMAKFHKMPWNTTFDEESLGGVANFTPSIGTIFRGVKHFTFHVRSDLLQQLQHTLGDFQANMTTTTTIPPSDHNNMDPYVTFPGRIKHIATFWNPNDKVRHAKFRNAVSTVVHKTGVMHNLTTSTEVVGNRGSRGRHRVHRAYVEALLEYKMIVVCQRDKWEDHWRLFESLISGALVFSDPMRDFPQGVKDTIVVYHSLQDLQQKLLYYLNHPDERMALATKARQVALSHHTIHRRWESLLLDDWSVVDEHGISLLN